MLWVMRCGLLEFLSVFSLSLLVWTDLHHSPLNLIFDSPIYIRLSHVLKKVICG
jgi:hypothetical protein